MGVWPGAGATIELLTSRFAVASVNTGLTWKAHSPDNAVPTSVAIRLDSARAHALCKAGAVQTDVELAMLPV